MTEDQIRNIILTKKYPFTMGDFFDHYSLAGFNLILPVMSIYYFLIDGYIDNFLFILSSISLLLGLSIFLYHGPKQRRFEEIKIDNKSDEELFIASEKIFIHLKWNIIESNKVNYIKAFRPWRFSFGANRGQVITIIIANGTIYAISLYSRLSQATFWKNRNHKNIAIFINGLIKLGITSAKPQAGFRA